MNMRQHSQQLSMGALRDVWVAQTTGKCVLSLLLPTLSPSISLTRLSLLSVSQLLDTFAVVMQTVDLRSTGIQLVTMFGTSITRWTLLCPLVPTNTLPSLAR